MDDADEVKKMGRIYDITDLIYEIRDGNEIESRVNNNENRENPDTNVSEYNRLSQLLVEYETKSLDMGKCNFESIVNDYLYSLKKYFMGIDKTETPGEDVLKMIESYNEQFRSAFSRLLFQNQQNKDEVQELVSRLSILGYGTKVVLEIPDLLVSIQENILSFTDKEHYFKSIIYAIRKALFPDQTQFLVRDVMLVIHRIGSYAVMKRYIDERSDMLLKYF